VIPFRVTLQAGPPVFEQVLYAARKAMLAGQLRPGDAFPSVRALSSALKINPNTAHKVVQNLLNEGLLEVRPGIGTVVAARPGSSAAERGRLLNGEVEALVVEAKHLGLSLADVQRAVETHWKKLEGKA
jgi:GntR family transcriptional regulator